MQCLVSSMIISLLCTVLYLQIVYLWTTPGCGNPTYGRPLVGDMKLYINICPIGSEWVILLLRQVSWRSWPGWVFLLVKCSWSGTHTIYSVCNFAGHGYCMTWPWSVSRDIFPHNNMWNSCLQYWLELLAEVAYQHMWQEMFDGGL